MSQYLIQIYLQIAISTILSLLLVPAEASDEKSALTVPLIIIIAISAAGVLLVLVLGTCNCIRNRQQTEKQDAPVCRGISEKFPCIV